MAAIQALSGYGNGVTALRAGLVAGLVGLGLVPDPGWWLVGLAGVAFALDGVDGWLARRLGEADAFGARFDVEVDGAFMAVLAVLAVHHGAAPLWGLALGAPYYLFRGAGLRWPALRRPLPASRRRRWICALQAAGLIVLVLPGLPPAFATALTGAVLTAVLASFVLDGYRLLRPARPEADAPAQGGLS